MKDPDRRTNRAARRYLLTRLLRCHHCSLPLVARPRDDSSRRYVCASGAGFGGCGKTTVVAHELEAFIVDAVLHRLDSPDLSRALKGSVSETDGAEWQAEIEQTQAKLDELIEMWSEGVIGRSELLKARAVIANRQALAKKRLAALNRTTALVPPSVMQTDCAKRGLR